MNENEFEQVPEQVPAEVPEQTAEPVKKNTDRRSFGEIAIAVIAMVLIVAAVAAMIMGGGLADVPGDGTAATVPADGNAEDVTCKGTYTVEDAAAMAASGQVIGTMGDLEMTNADLQIYYWMQVVTFLNEAGYYASYYGLDYTQPLDTQACLLAEGLTWQQYFLDVSLETWHAYKALAEEAKSVGFDKQSEDYQTYAAALQSDVRASAESYGYNSISAMLEEIVGPGSTEDAYIDYMKTYYLGYLYFNHLMEEQMPTDADIEAYFDENAAVYAESGLDKETGNYIDVRHILIMPTGGTTNEAGETVYSDEEWEAARVEAQRILDLWLAGDRSEESFGELAMEYTHDGNGADGGLYTDVEEGYMVPAFNDWCFDAARQVGDYGLVQTEFGYHVMYFSGSRPIWYATAKSDMETELANAIAPAAMEKFEVSFDYKSMVLGEVSLA